MHKPLAFAFPCPVASSRLGWTWHDAGTDGPSGQAAVCPQASPAPWPALCRSAFNMKAPTPPPLPSISVEEFTVLAFTDVQCSYFIAIYSKLPNQHCNDMGKRLINKPWRGAIRFPVNKSLGVAVCVFAKCYN